MSSPAAIVRLARLQSLYYAITGVWPLLSMRSFEAITGPKTDRWLVKTVALLLTIIGVALGMASRRRAVSPELALLAAGSAAALATIDTVYVAKRRIRPVYLLDALAQGALLAGWVRWWGRR